jgi:hypothetical protein
VRRDFQPGVVVLAKGFAKNIWVALKYTQLDLDPVWRDSPWWHESYVDMLEGETGIVLGAHGGVWIYLLRARCTIRAKTPERYFRIVHRPKRAVREAVEACVMANEADAATRVALDDYRGAP